MKFFSLASGSTGNAFLIDNGQELLLIDVGITYKRIKEKLSELHYDINDVKYILITHAHNDHIKSLNSFSMEKIYSSVKIPGVKNKIEKNTQLSLGTYNVISFPLSHDVECCGYRIECNNKSLVYLTDTGYVNFKIKRYLENADYYVFESNHDINMLMDSDRPYYLKSRILSDKGHLSNYDSAKYLSKFIGNKTKYVLLAHLSEENNTKELAYNTLTDRLTKENIQLENIIIANQNEETEFITI
jgi:phosphoribosyl 1,2-cyclic phosphodiesterase